MKIILLFLVAASSQAFSTELCEVYGISDSPQSLTCTFRNEKITVTCRNGLYYVEDDQVEGAYHLEVEEGPTPLVFRIRTGELTVTMGPGRKHEAVLTTNGKKMTGNCRL